MTAAKPKLGQHFLTAPSYAKRIAESIPAGTGERVLEIGAGTGALSIYIQSRFPDFHLVELDRNLITRLREKLGKGSWTLHAADVLKLDFSEIGFPLHVAGNLPYGLTGAIVRKTLMYGSAIASCTFMVQREVAQRITGGFGTRGCGFLTVFCNYFGVPRMLFHVPPGAFFPPPKVRSSVFRIIIQPEFAARLPRAQWEDFFGFVSTGFMQRRKKLVKALRGRVDTKRCVEALQVAGLDESVRAERLTTEQWVEIYRMVRGA